MNENISEEKNEIGEQHPWCPRCSSHTHTTQRDSKDVCAVCYEDGVFTPVNTKLAYMGLGILALFFFLASLGSWGKLSFFISVILAGFSIRHYLKYRKWAEWAVGERRRERKRRRSKKKKQRKQKREKPSFPRKDESPPPATPPDDIRKDRTPVEDPVPKPPPPPPDFDD